MKNGQKTRVAHNTLRVKRLGIEAQRQDIVFMRRDCHVCRSEGFTGHARVRVTHGNRSVIATLFHVSSGLLAENEAGLSDSAIKRLNVEDGDLVVLSHPVPVKSMSDVRSKIYGRTLDSASYRDIIKDIVLGRYSDIELSSFVTACSARPLEHTEMIGLTEAMVGVGERLDWGTEPIMDKHCVGGLAGNRTTPIVVAIVAVSGLLIPKTSSRAITSPAGTADAMETLAPVDLSISDMRRVVEAEGGCVVWGGAVRLSPADDILIRIERALDIDSEGQLVASVMSKKIAAGATQVVLDLPVGPTAKVRDEETAIRVGDALSAVGKAFNVEARALPTDGLQPVGRGIGPALEARDVLAVLQNRPEAPSDLRDRATTLAGILLEMGGKARPEEGKIKAQQVIESGQAWTKFQAICEAQGGMRTPPMSNHRHEVVALRSGIVNAIDNRRISKAAKLAGAPEAHAAGVDSHKQLRDRVEKGEPLFTLHAETPGELHYALTYVTENDPIMTIGPS
ncbi:MAG: thymidine phosphorylase family protein [Alphaproteobacteria bacterium]